MKQSHSCAVPDMLQEMLIGRNYCPHEWVEPSCKTDLSTDRYCPCILSVYTEQCKDLITASEQVVPQGFLLGVFAQYPSTITEWTTTLQMNCFVVALPLASIYCSNQKIERPL